MKKYINYMLKAGLAVVALVLLQLGASTSALAQQTGSDFDHSATGFVITAQHLNVRCETCHVKGVFKGTPKTCEACHGWNNPIATTVMPVNHIPTGNAPCESCHASNMTQFQDALRVFSHVSVPSQSCISCHSANNPRPGVTVNPSDATHAKALANNTPCGVCHTTIQFQGLKPPPNHIPYAPVACANCHTGTDFSVMPSITAIHANAPSSSNNCAQCHSAAAAVTYASATMVPPLVGPPGNHIGMSGQSCEACHVGAGSSLQLPVLDGSRFTNSKFSHQGVSTGCAACHGPSVIASSFAGMRNIIVMPDSSSPGPLAHIPSSTTCETCHASNMPAGQINAAATATVPGTGFQGPPLPTKDQVHMGITSNCAACHDTNAQWVGMSSYPLTGYAGFQTRPQIGAGQFNVSDGAHPMSGDCSQCHTGISFDPSLVKKPNNHIPVAAASQCSSCHNLNDFSAMPSLTAIHANAPSTQSNCAQCHSAANAAYYAMPTMVPALVGPPGGHISQGSAGCESCHVGANSSIVNTPVVNGAKFIGSLFNHAGSTVTCDACHGLSVTPTTFFGVYPKTISDLSPGHVPTTASCDSCHVSGAPAGLVPTAGMTTTFANAQYLHAASNTGCANCHGPTLSGSSFYGVTSLIVMPPTTAGGHLPTSTTCESCHALSKPTVLIPAVSPYALGSSLFRNPPPNGTQVHSNMVGNCSSCHEAGSSWVGLDLPQYSLKPSSYTGLTTTLYTGFQTRPLGTASTSNNAVTDNGHPGINSGDCSLCHGDTNAFATPGAPTNHIPYKNGAACGDCHVNFGTAPTIDKIHLNIQSQSTNCEQCHSTANAALYASSTTLNPIKTPAANHIGMGNLGCDKCHVGYGSDTPQTPVPLGAKFSKSAFSHSGITTSCGDCHGPNVASGTFDGVTPKTISSGAPNHLPVSNSVSCENCHVNSIPPSPVPPTGYAGSPSFAGGQFIHTYITNGCATCHGPNIQGGGNSFTGVQNIVVMPPTTANGGHIPTTITTCETCHAGSIPTGLLSVTASHVMPGSGFANSPPDSSTVHTGVTGGCDSCHSANNAWLGMLPAYPRNLTSLNTSNPAQLYTGFHTRPGVVTTYSMYDQGHPNSPADCSKCHGDFAAFGQPSKPANHIPYAANAACSSCHVDWNLTPTTAAIHTYLPSGATNCAQCHSDPNATTYSVGATKPIVKPASNHIYMRGLGCESCHVGQNSSVTAIPFSGTPTFGGSAFSHSGMTTGCADCHGQGINNQTFQGINTIVVMPPSTTPGNTSHLPTSTTCENCHFGSTPSLQVAGNAAHQAPNSGFKTPAPTPGMVHSGVTGGCSNCHESGMDWMSVNITDPNYTPSGPPYVGFQTRPGNASPTGYSVVDINHPSALSSGDCSQCHSGFTVWATAVKSKNHIPSSNTCTGCHVSSGAGINYTTMPTYASIHDNANSATGTLGACSQCHSDSNAQLYKTTNMTVVGPNVGSTATGTHIGMASLDCADCHVGNNTSLTTVVGMADSAHFNSSAFSHTGATGTCASCHAVTTPFRGGLTPVSTTSPTLTPGHISNPANLDCGACHTNVLTGLFKLNSSSNSTSFANGKFSHSGITTTCSACHGSSVTGNTFYNINSIVTINSLSGHIPSPTNASCETCHLANTPISVISGNAASITAGNTKFYSPMPSGVMIHTSIINGCSACHETGMTWLGVGLYPKTMTTTAAGNVYTGFNTRPVVSSQSAATPTAFYIPGHPTGTADCSTCHGSTVNFSAAALPTNHIPYNTGTACNLCHTNLGTGSVPVSSATDFSSIPAVSVIHQYSTSYKCSQCHSAANATTYANSAVPFAITSPAKTKAGVAINHIPYGTSECNVCHTAPNSVSTYADFTGGLFTHTGITTGCAACHGAGITTSTFIGVTAIVAIPASTTVNGPNTHIPYAATVGCEVCHAGSTPTALLGVTSTGTGFATPLVANTTLHNNSTSFSCMTCHERGYQWLGMGKYTRAPLTFSSTAPATTAYTGFQTRPGVSGGTYGYNDPNHAGTPANSLDTADCATCHIGTTQFTGEGKPAGHMPTTAATCVTCHGTAGDYSYFPAANGAYAAGSLTSLANLHTGITGGQVTFTAATLAKKTCTTCHVAGTGGTSGTAPFAGCAKQDITCTSPPSISYQPKMMSAIAKHVPISTLDCNACHAVFTAFGTTTKLGSIGHANVKLAAMACMSCHEAGLTWTNASPKTRPSNHTKTKAAPNDCGNSGCHTYNGGFRALLSPIMRGALVSPDTSRVRPDLQTGMLTRGSLGNTYDHSNVKSGQCKNCHDGKLASGMPARHLMVTTSCDICHRSTSWLPAQFSHNGVSPNTCMACHNGLKASTKPSGHFMTSRSCDSCHKTIAWVPVQYQHMSPQYQPSPTVLTCTGCHITNGEIIPRQMRGLNRTKPIPVGP